MDKILALLELVIPNLLQLSRVQVLVQELPQIAKRISISIKDYPEFFSWVSKTFKNFEKNRFYERVNIEGYNQINLNIAGHSKDNKRSFGYTKLTRLEQKAKTWIFIDFNAKSILWVSKISKRLEFLRQNIHLFREIIWLSHIPQCESNISHV